MKRCTVIFLLSCFVLHGSVAWGMKRKKNVKFKQIKESDSSCENRFVLQNARILIGAFASFRQRQFSVGFHKVFNSETQYKDLFLMATSYVDNIDQLLLRIRTLQDVVGLTQEIFLREKGKRRCEVQDDFVQEEKKELHPIFERMGFINAIMPKKEKYRWIVLFGARVNVVLRRVEFMFELFRRGSIQEAISLVVLTGQNGKETDESWKKASGNRFNLKKCLEEGNFCLPLRKDWKEEMKETPETEYEMIRLLFDILDLSKLPWGKKFIEGACFVNTPLKETNTIMITRNKGAKKKGVQPNTGDTVRHWLDRYGPQPGRTLGISNQPYGPRQGKVLKRVLSSEDLLEPFDVDEIECASAPLSDYNTRLVLDEVGRDWYEMDKQSPQKK